LVIGVRMAPKLERRLNQVVHQLGTSRSACIHATIGTYLLRHGDDEVARRQLQRLVGQPGARNLERAGARL
jgi:predicted DNA-binding protein